MLIRDCSQLGFLSGSLLEGFGHLTQSQGHSRRSMQSKRLDLKACQTQKAWAQAKYPVFEVSDPPKSAQPWFLESEPQTLGAWNLCETTGL